jgi:hypothetical protein
LKLYTYKAINCGFIVLCPESNSGLLKRTVNSIKSRYSECSVICATEESAKDENFNFMNEICPTYRGQETFSSLINAGMNNTKSDWNFIICAGSFIPTKIDQRFSYFLESKKDILFPIVNNKTNFVEATLNGLFINKETWDEVGEMANIGPLEVVKLMWALDAIKKGVKFKAISGTKIC